jgi:hypothetical protein
MLLWFQGSWLLDGVVCLTKSVISCLLPHSVCRFGPLACLNPSGLALFCRFPIWALKQAPLLVKMGQDLRRVFETGEGDARNILWKLLQLPKWLATLPQCVACGVLHLLGDKQIPDAGNPGQGGKHLAQGRGSAIKDDGGSRRLPPMHPLPVQTLLVFQPGGEISHARTR